MQENHVKVALNAEQFRKLVCGEEVEIQNPPTGPHVHVIIRDVGFTQMYASLDYAQLSPDDRKIADAKELPDPHITSVSKPERSSAA